jgi:hypothetical protein
MDVQLYQDGGHSLGGHLGLRFSQYKAMHSMQYIKMTASRRTIHLNSVFQGVYYYIIINTHIFIIYLNKIDKKMYKTMSTLHILKHCKV